MHFDRQRVTAAIPAYNSEEFLADAITSVLEQSYACVECLVVDDASTDATIEIARSFSEVRYVSQNMNSGVSSARNRAIKEARGDFIAFLDADDVWLPTKIEAQMRYFEDDPSLGLVYSGLMVVKKDLTGTEEVRAAPGESALRNTLLAEKPYISGLGSTGVVPTPIARSILFDERMTTSADWAFGCAVARRYRVSSVSYPLVLYRQHSRAQMHRDLAAVEHDMELLWDDFFGEGGSLDNIGSRRRAEANLYLSLAAGYRNRSDHRAFFRYLTRAMFRRPDRVAAAFWRYFGPER